MQTNEQFLKEFFKDHKGELEANYPGLNYAYFEEAYLNFIGVKACDFYLGNLKSNEFFEHCQMGAPFEYLSQRRTFYRSNFSVSEDVLIPRFETESLVELALKEVKGKTELSFVDIGCGSGAIGLSLLRELKSLKLKKTRALLIDLSPAALNISKKNYQKLQYFFGPHQMNFLETDRLNGVTEHFDLILSNPPYIMDEGDDLHANVLKYEPHLALFLNQKEYFSWFSSFFAQISKHLNQGGVFLMEGSEKHLASLKDQCLKDFDFSEVTVLKDLTGRERFLCGRK